MKSFYLVLVATFLVLNLIHIACPRKFELNYDTDEEESQSENDRFYDQEITLRTTTALQLEITPSLSYSAFPKSNLLENKNESNDQNKNQDENNNDHTTSSWTIFFILSVLACSILVIHILIESKFHYLPESIAIVFLGALIGLLFKLLSQWKISDWTVKIKQH
jgi:hypothetical protein